MPDSLPRLAEALKDRYRVEREIGQGGMATVYLAHDVRHNRKVAVKVLAAELAAMIGAERFLKEIEVTANLQHPHILPLFDSGIAQAGEGEGSRFLYYVMPFVEGDTLRDKLDREKELSVKEAVELTRSVAAALDYAHRHGVVHRDIKPENVLLHDGQAMVADFGIALAIREAGGTRLTGTGLSVGTPSYMSPEQAMGDREVDARSDIYSLGAMLYEMLTGTPPFSGNTAQAIVAKILTETAPRITKTRSSVPANVEAAIHRALERLPADRFATAAEFAEALGNPAFTTPGVAGAGAATTEPRSLWNPLSIATAGMAVAAVLAAGWLATRPNPEAPVRRLALSLPANEGLNPSAVNRLAMAPDGSGFVFAGVDASGTARLMYRSFAQLAATPLPGTEGGTSPAFSPDGTRIAFLSVAPFAVKVVALNGAPAITLVADEVIGGGVAWSADDWIYFDAGDRLDRVRGSGGDRERVVALDTANAEVGFAWPDPLPNGRGLLYRSRRAGESTQSYVIKVLDLRTRESRVLVPGVVARYASSGHLLFVTSEGVLLAQPFDPGRMELTGAATPITQGIGVAGFGGVDLALAASGDLLYVSASITGGERFSWVNRDGSSRIVDPNWNLPSETVLDFALSPDGRRLAVTIGAGGVGALSDIWIKELDDGPLTKLTFEHINRAPAWAPDGRAIIYSSARADDPNVLFRLHRISADGTGSPEPLPADARGADAVAVSSRDGWVVVGTGDGGARSADILAFRLGIDTAMTPLLETPAFEGLPAVSPDGRWLAYTSVESGAAEVYIRPFPEVNRGKWQVSLDGGFMPRWSPDGGELYYANLANRFLVASIRTTPTLSIGRREVLHTLGPIPGYDVHPDGQGTLRLWSPTLSDSTSAQLVLIQNFLGTLKGIK